MKNFSIVMILVFSIFVLTGCSNSEKNKAPKEPVVTNNQSQVKETPKTSEVNSEQTDIEESFSGSMVDMLKKGKSMKCTYSMVNDGAEVSATAYFDNKNARYFAETEMNIPGQGKQVSYMLLLNKESYAWMKGTTAGTKFVDNSSENETTTENDTSDFSQEDNIDFKCKSWVVDANVFNLPKDVKFTDYTSNFDEANEANAEIEANIKKYQEMGN